MVTFLSAVALAEVDALGMLIFDHTLSGERSNERIIESANMGKRWPFIFIKATKTYIPKTNNASTTKSAVSANLYEKKINNPAKVPIANCLVVIGPIILSSTSINCGTMNCGILYKHQTSSSKHQINFKNQNYYFSFGVFVFGFYLMFDVWLLFFISVCYSNP